MTSPRIHWLVLAWILGLTGGLWILFVGGTSHHSEMLVGLGVLIASTLFVEFVWRTRCIPLKFEARDVFAGWRIPLQILSGVSQILRVLWNDLRGRPAGSFYRYCGFKTSASDPRLIARRVLATAYTTATPNFIVIGIDASQSRLLFQQIERTEIPAMMKALGATPGKAAPAAERIEPGADGDQRP